MTLEACISKLSMLQACLYNQGDFRTAEVTAIVTLLSHVQAMQCDRLDALRDMLHWIFTVQDRAVFWVYYALCHSSDA